MQNPYLSITNLKPTKITDAQKALSKGLIRLCNKKPIYKISVKELIQESNVARSTFYIYYQNIDELLEDIENYHIVKLINLNECVMNPEIKSEEYVQYYNETINYVQNHRDLFYAFLIANVNNRFIKKWKDAIKYHLLERKHNLYNTENCNLILEMVAAQIIAAYTFWLTNPDKVNPNSLDKIVYQTLKSIEI